MAKSFEQDGFVLTWATEYDPDTGKNDCLDEDNPEDAERLRAFERGDWHYVNVLVRCAKWVYIPGHIGQEIVLATDCIGGVESDSGDDYFEWWAHELAPDAIKHAKDVLHDLAKGLM